MLEGTCTITITGTNTLSGFLDGMTLLSVVAGLAVEACTGAVWTTPAKWLLPSSVRTAQGVDRWTSSRASFEGSLQRLTPTLIALSVGVARRKTLLILSSEKFQFDFACHLPACTPQQAQPHELDKLAARLGCRWRPACCWQHFLV